MCGTCAFNGFNHLGQEKIRFQLEVYLLKKNVASLQDLNTLCLRHFPQGKKLFLCTHTEHLQFYISSALFYQG